MGTLRDKIERFLRGETYLHFATMFFIQVIILQLNLPFWVFCIIPIVVGVGKELFDKFHDGKYISLTDILGTVLGGYSAILILKYL